MEKSFTNYDTARILKEIRENNSLSKSDMASFLRVDGRTYQRYESGESAPSISDFLEMASCLGSSVMPIILKNLYPERFENYSEKSGVEECREMLINYIEQIATPRDVMQLAFLLFAHHGSSVASQLQIFTALDHLPIDQRLLVAKIIINIWEIESARNTISMRDYPLPDIEMLKQTIIKTQLSLTKEAET